MENGDEEAAAQQQYDKEQVFLTCKLAVAQAIAACRGQAQGYDTGPSSTVKVTVRGGKLGRFQVKGESLFVLVDTVYASVMVMRAQACSVLYNTCRRGLGSDSVNDGRSRINCQSGDGDDGAASVPAIA